jgi:uncharacterized protein
MSTRLAIVGASVRAAAQSALRAGFEVVGADLFADADLDGVCPITKIEDYPHGFADWLAEQDVDAWMYTGALENYPDLVDHMATIKPLWGVSGEALRRCRDPLVLQEVFNEAGVAFPETRRINEVDWRKRVWLAKSYRHSNGAGVWAMNSEADVALAAQEAAYAQLLVPGFEQSAIFAVDDDSATLLGVTWQWTRLREPRGIQVGYAGSVGPLRLKCDCRRFVRRMRPVLSQSLGVRGVVGVDFVGWDDNWYAIEINPRYTASVEVLERAFGVSAISFHSNCFVQSPRPQFKKGKTACYGKQVIYATQQVEVDELLGAEMIELQKSGQLSDVPRTGTAIGAGEPICTILVEGASIDLVTEQLHTFAKSLLARCVTRG